MSSYDPNSPNKPGAPPSPETTQWHLHVGSENYGPYTLAQLRDFARDGRLTAETLVWSEGADGWRAAGEQPALKALFAATPPPPPPGARPPAAPNRAVAALEPSADPRMGGAAPKMSFGRAVHVCFREKYATFQGRARRAEYWWFALFTSLIFVLVEGIAGGLIAATANEGSTSIVGILAGIVVFLVALGLILPSLAVGVRRLHDLGWSGWWFLAQVIPFVSLIMLIGFMMRGETGANKYGPDPLEGG